ncbi:MAG: phage tail protein [Prochloraceae cyanobacterium]
MNYSNSFPVLSLEIMPQQLLESVLSREDNYFSLLVYPGKPSEILVKLTNDSDRILNWKIQIQGDFPSSCCNWHQEKEEIIEPRQKITKIISFIFPIDFFENQLVLNYDRPRLKLDREVKILVQAESNKRKQIVAYETFYLAIRPQGKYINLLPDLYKETDFLNRFLAIFEQTFDPAVQTLETLWAYLDPLTAPDIMLPFLAKWVAWEIDARWDKKQQRRFIRNATILYRWRGTRFGLRFYLHLYTGLPLDENLPESEKHISIKEDSSKSFILGSTALGREITLGGGRPYHFFVSLRLKKSERIDEKLVREIIEKEKPPFCTYDLEFIYS